LDSQPVIIGRAVEYLNIRKALENNYNKDILMSVQVKALIVPGMCMIV